MQGGPTVRRLHRDRAGRARAREVAEEMLKEDSLAQTADGDGDLVELGALEHGEEDEGPLENDVAAVTAETGDLLAISEGKLAKGERDSSTELRVSRKLCKVLRG